MSPIHGLVHGPYYRCLLQLPQLEGPSRPIETREIVRIVSRHAMSYLMRMCVFASRRGVSESCLNTQQEREVNARFAKRGPSTSWQEWAHTWPFTTALLQITFDRTTCITHYQCTIDATLLKFSCPHTRALIASSDNLTGPALHDVAVAASKVYDQQRQRLHRRTLCQED